MKTDFPRIWKSPVKRKNGEKKKNEDLLKKKEHYEIKEIK